MTNGSTVRAADHLKLKPAAISTPREVRFRL